LCRWLIAALLFLAVGVAARGWSLAASEPQPVVGSATAATDVLVGAAQRNDSATALRALSEGADANRPDQTGQPPLAWAVLFGNDQLTDRLLAAGADPRWRDEAGKTLLHLAAVWPVLDPPGTPSTLVSRPSLAGKQRIIGLLVSRGADPRAMDANGMTPLHYGVLLPGPETDVLPIVDVLLNAGSPVHARNVHGFTAGDLARRNHRLDIADRLAKTPDAPDPRAPSPPR
jgi:ankyrin repeat protein